jgi:hypothetical protein
MVAAFHALAAHGTLPRADARRLVLARKTGVGAIRRPVLVALGIRLDGKKCVIDFCLAQSETPPNGSVSSARCAAEPGPWASSPTARP